MSDMTSHSPCKAEVDRLEELAVEISSQAANLYGLLRHLGMNDELILDDYGWQSADQLVAAIDKVRAKGPINEVLAFTCWISEVKPCGHGMSIQFDREIAIFVDRLLDLRRGESVSAEDSPLFWRTLLVLVSAGVESDIVSNMHYL